MILRNRIRTFVTGGVTASVLVLACSSNDSSTPTGSSSTPEGTVAVPDAGLQGCSPLEQGCFTDPSGAYTAPAVKTTCASPGGPDTSGAADTHCAGQPYQTVSAGSCGVTDAGPSSEDAGSQDAGSEDAGPQPTCPATGGPGCCGENGSDYGPTEYGTSANDDDCKYAVSYTASPICENDGTYFIVKASYLTGTQGPLTGACTFVEACLSDTHPAPAIDSRPPSGKQTVVEGPPGTYTIGPVQFDAPGTWTVRFHFNEECCDVADDSPHGHAAFFVNVP